MKGIWLIILGALLFFGIVYYMDKNSLDPTFTDQNNTSEFLPFNFSKKKKGMPVKEEEKYEPLDLSSYFSFVGKAYAGELPSKLSPRSLGDAQAPIKMYVFSSLTCTHCSVFHETTLKEIEEKYIKTGEVQMTYIDFPVDRPALAGAMLARCVKPENYFSFLNELFKNQNQWAYKANASEYITNYASLEGMTKADIDLCLADKTLQEKIIQDRDYYIKHYKINATPSVLLVNNDKEVLVVGDDKEKLEIALEEMIK